jgi:hypothetical protein
LSISNNPVSQRSTPAKKRRFSADSLNDLLFWGIHFAIVGISLAIVWTKIDSTTKVLRTLIAAQNQQLVLTQQQLGIAKEEAEHAKAMELQRSTEVKRSFNSLNTMMLTSGQIQHDVNYALSQIQEINRSMLTVAQTSKSAALQAAGAANVAANASSAAANASSSTRALVRSRVVTTEDKVQIQQQQRALAAKKAQLNRTIRSVKTKGPTLLQKLFQ